MLFLERVQSYFFKKAKMYRCLHCNFLQAATNDFSIIMNDFEKIISFENLYKAHRRARLGKRHKKEVTTATNY